MPAARSVVVTSDAPVLARVVGDRLALTCGNHVTLVDLTVGRILAELRLGGD